MKTLGRLVPAAKAIRFPLGEKVGVWGATRPELLVTTVLRLPPNAVIRPTFVTWRSGLQPSKRSHEPCGEKNGSESHDALRRGAGDTCVRPEPSRLTVQMPVPGRAKAMRPFAPGRVAAAGEGRAGAAPPAPAGCPEKAGARG